MSYEQRGVSANKSEVHAAIRNLDKGLYPNAFCKILPDLVANDPSYCNIMHADTAGTKSSLAYLYWKETGNLDVWKGIVQDAIVMNLDDMACAGATDNIILSSTIGRNKGLISGEALKALIGGTMEFIERMREQGVEIHLAGGETADVGDIVRTVDVGFTAFARFPRKEVVDIHIKPGNVIVGLASYGQASYEDNYNSGIGSNGLTFARHEVLSAHYAAEYPESFDPSLDKKVVYTGKNKLTDTFEGFEVGQLLLSPTRTFLPLIRALLSEFRPAINGIIHNTGGGQTKVLHFAEDVHIVKNDLLPVPPVFRLIQSQSNADWKEMYQVFNMGQRLEVYTDEKSAERILALGKEFHIDARITGYCEPYKGKKLSLKTVQSDLTY